MRKRFLLLPLLLTACAQQSVVQAPDHPQQQDERAILQMTVVASSLDSWPYRNGVTFAIPDDHLHVKEQGKTWLPFIQQATAQRLQALGLKPAPASEANVIVSIGVLGEKENADSLVFAKLGMSPGGTELSKGTIALVIQDRQTQAKLWSSALQANSSAPIKATEARERTARSLVEQMTNSLPPAL
ncbi:MAG: DUF4136 domain-containing protein [Aeromonadaceae bacterium]